MVEILQNFVVLSEYTNFDYLFSHFSWAGTLSQKGHKLSTNQNTIIHYFLGYGFKQKQDPVQVATAHLFRSHFGNSFVYVGW